ncbi:MFS transporter [Amycolatopsis palatopharyngis]|uniref:MFS transporter n=1 Tax=Amycolatopsis palatopharyngis TaxID=187982 RepID=UPI001FE933EC|nr:MFS transporter [Amycolatopsis palatopharyngis]
MKRRAPLLAVLIASGLSAAGSAMTLIAIPWFVLDTTGSGARTGLIAALETLGLLLSVALAGPLVDRYGARLVSMLSDLGTVVAVAAIPLAYATTGLSFPALAALAFGIGLGRSPARTAKSVLLPQAIETAGASVERGTSAQEAVQRLGDLLGAPAGGALIAVFGAAPVLLIDAGAILGGVLLVGVLVPAGSPSAHSGTGVRGYLGDLRDAMIRLRGDRLLFAIGIVVAVTNALFVGLASVLLPAYGSLVWHNSALVGMAIAAVGVGGLLGAGLYGWLGAQLPRRMTFVGCFLLSGPPTFAALALDPHPVLLLVLLVVSSLGRGPLNPILAGVKYERVPVEFRGRVFAVLTTAALAAMPLGTLLAGVLLDVIGLRPAVLVLGGLCLLATSCPLVFPVWRGLDRATEPAKAATPKVSPPATSAHG